ncbi:hypothetical protein OIU76_020419 [Salix suchowensis]|nr:hypothetical protein OIU76_020419 [Salix suchowensis]
MAWPAVLVIVPVGIIFILSGLIVNLIQAVLFILVRPVSRSLHRKINKIVAELLWLELIVLVDWWANLKIEVYADDETFELLGVILRLSLVKNMRFVISNHKSDLDWLIGWIFSSGAEFCLKQLDKTCIRCMEVVVMSGNNDFIGKVSKYMDRFQEQYGQSTRSGCLGSALAVMKNEAKVLPIIGWSMWFSDYVFLERSWGKDERTLQTGFEQLADFPMPFWLALFVEGTRFTQAKLQVAQEFAASRGLPVPKNVLIPRTKGFVSAVTHLRSFVPAIYDATVAVANSQPAPTFLRIFRGQSSVIKVLVERHSMQELPETADGIAQWCKDAFVTKDATLEKYFEKDIFSDKKLQDIGRP